MARWIFEFRSTGERPLSEAEQSLLLGALSRFRIRGAVFEAVSGAFFVLALVSFWAALQFAGGYGAITLVCTILGFGARSPISDSRRRGMLYRRQLFLGTVERFERVPGDQTVRDLWHRPVHCADFLEEQDREEGEFEPQEKPIWGPFWASEQQFEEALSKTIGRRPDSFETVGQDGVVVFVEGVRVEMNLEPRVWTTKPSDR